MIPVSVFLFLAAVAGALALYSFLERQSWMYSQITAAGLAAALLWVLALMLASGNVGYMVMSDPSPPPILFTDTDIVPDPPPQVLRLLDPTLPYIFALFAVVMTVYFVLHIANWLQDRITNREEEEES